MLAVRSAVALPTSAVAVRTSDVTLSKSEGVR
jgi:hypothetical protein